MSESSMIPRRANDIGTPGDRQVNAMGRIGRVGGLNVPGVRLSFPVEAVLGTGDGGEGEGSQQTSPMRVACEVAKSVQQVGIRPASTFVLRVV